MKKSHLAIVLILLTGAGPVCAQRATATFDDGTSINYDVVHNKFGDSKPLNILLGGLDLGSVGGLDGGGGEKYFLGVSYYAKDKFFGSINAGYVTSAAASIEGTYFVKSWDKNSKITIPLKDKYVGSNTIKRYVIKDYAIETRKHIGPHAGFAYSNYDLSGLKCSGSFVVGLGYMHGRHLQMIIANEKPVKMIRTRQFNLYADMVYYFLSYSSTYTEPKLSPIGFRFYFTGKTSFWSRSDWGLKYGLGIGTVGPVSIYPIASLGLYWAL